MVSIWCPTSPFKTVLEESASNEDRHKNSGQNYRIELRNHSLDMNRIPEEAVEAVHVALQDLVDGPGHRLGGVFRVEQQVAVLIPPALEVMLGDVVR